MTYDWNEETRCGLIEFAQQAVRTRCYSDEEGNFARLIEAKMKTLGYTGKVQACIRTHGVSVHGSAPEKGVNAVPSGCEIYLDRRLRLGETTKQAFAGLDELVRGKHAVWEIGALRRTNWNGDEFVYEPVHEPRRIAGPLTRRCNEAYAAVCGRAPEKYDFWDFGTNAPAPVGMGVPTIGYGCGDYKLAHMRDERCAVKDIEEACRFYIELIARL